MNNLFVELKRRNVFKVGIAYLIVGWLTVQVVASISPMLELPDVFGKMILIVMLIGFPFALIFAWAFELTPEGIKKSKDVEASTSITNKTSRKIDFIIIGALVLIIGGMAYTGSFTNSDTAKEELAIGPALTPSIAVLPFKDMSEKGDQAYMGEGIADELLNALAQEEGLSVTARTSSFVFSDGKTPITEIGSQLNVSHVLEGSVRRSDTRIRITAQLIDTRSGNHLWSKTYTKEIKDIFALEDEIVGEIHTSLLEELLGKRSARKTISINPEAFDLYLQGQQSFKQRTFDSLKAAEVSLKAALTLEPDFHAARIALAQVFTWQIGIGSHTDLALHDEAEALLNVVLTAEPDNSGAYYALALNAWFRGDQESSIQYIKQAYKLNPNDADIITLYVPVMGAELGENAIRELFARAERLDPLNNDIVLTKAQYLQYALGAYAEAEAAFKRAIMLNPKDGTYPFNLSFLHSNYMGDVAGAVSDLELTKTLDPNDPDSAIYLSEAYLSLGDGEQALHYAHQAIDLVAHNAKAIEQKINALIFLGKETEALTLAVETLDEPQTFYRRTTRGSFVRRAVAIYLKADELDAAEALVTKHFPETASLIDAAPPKTAQEIGDGTSILILSSIYKAQGLTDKAVRLTDRLSLLDEAFFMKGRSRLSGDVYQNLAVISNSQNRSDDAIKYLELMIDNGFLAGWRSAIIQSPYFTSLNDDPRFLALVERIEVEMARQLALVKARDGNQ